MVIEKQSGNTFEVCKKKTDFEPARDLSADHAVIMSAAKAMFFAQCMSCVIIGVGVGCDDRPGRSMFSVDRLCMKYEVSHTRVHGVHSPARPVS